MYCLQVDVDRLRMVVSMTMWVWCRVRGSGLSWRPPSRRASGVLGKYGFCHVPIGSRGVEPLHGRCGVSRRGLYGATGCCSIRGGVGRRVVLVLGLYWPQVADHPNRRLFSLSILGFRR